MCPECGKAPLRKLAPLPNKPGSERWICPFVREKPLHKGLVYDVAYVLRNPENQKQIDKEQSEFQVAVEKLRVENEARVAKGEPPQQLRLSHPYDWESARPGDVIIARDFRKVYVVAPDGSRRTSTDENANLMAINRIKEALARDSQQAK